MTVIPQESLSELEIAIAAWAQEYQWSEQLGSPMVSDPALELEDGEQLVLAIRECALGLLRLSEPERPYKVIARGAGFVTTRRLMVYGDELLRSWSWNDDLWTDVIAEAHGRGVLFVPRVVDERQDAPILNLVPLAVVDSPELPPMADTITAWPLWNRVSGVFHYANGRLDQWRLDTMRAILGNDVASSVLEALEARD